MNQSISEFDKLPDDSLVRPRIAAELLGCSLVTVHRMARDGRLRKITVGKRHAGFRAGDLRQLMRGVN